jgi:hypothetical protein
MPGDQSDPVYEADRTHHGRRVYQDVVEEEHQHQGVEEADAYREAPKGPVRVDLVQEGVEEQEPCVEASPGHQEEAPNGIELHKEEAEEETDQEGAAEDDPADPEFLTMLREGAVDDQDDQGCSLDHSGDEDKVLEIGLSREAHYHSEKQEEGEYCVLIGIYPDKEGVNPTSLTPCFACESQTDVRA